MCIKQKIHNFAIVNVNFNKRYIKTYTIMKKLLLVAGIAFGIGASAQTIVSTEVQNRNVVIEEYTGIGCGYCPAGHENVATYSKQHPGRVVTINIHQGGYAQGYYPNYTTKWGNQLAAQATITGYPAGTLNRRMGTDGRVANVGPSGTSWFSTANQYLSMQSPVNVAATATIDASTKILTVHVETYYTQDVTDEVGLLTVALLQNNVVGEQHNYGPYNTEQIVALADDYSTTYNTVYSHMHMLRDLITGSHGVWGDTIVTANTEGIIPAGTYVERDYTYQLPEYYQDYSYGSTTHVPLELGDIDIAVFVAQGRPSGNSIVSSSEIYTGTTVAPTYINMDGVDATISTGSVTAEDVFGCNNLENITVKVKNTAGEDVTSLGLKVTNPSNGSEITYDWTGSLSTFESEKITLPAPISVIKDQSNTLNAVITSINGNAVEKEPVTGTVTRNSLLQGKLPLSLIIRTDTRGNEITWKVYDNEGNTLQEGGPYEAGTKMRDTIELSSITTDGCYSFEIFDAGGDGVSSGNYKLKDADGTTLIANLAGSWRAGEKKAFQVGTVSLSDANGNIFQSLVYPNPAQKEFTLSLNVVNAIDAEISVVDLMGRTVLNLGRRALVSGSNQIEVNTENLQEGMYYVRVVTNDGITTNKLTITK